jgi:hypothetical protein
MDTSILHAEIQKYINSQLGVAITKLALQKNPFPEVNWISILNQIAAKSKIKDKLPTYFSHENLIYPNKVSDFMTYYSHEYAPKKEDGIMVLSTGIWHQFPLLNYLQKINYSKFHVSAAQADQGEGEQARLLGRQGDRRAPPPARRQLRRGRLVPVAHVLRVRRCEAQACTRGILVR